MRHVLLLAGCALGVGCGEVVSHTDASGSDGARAPTTITFTSYNAAGQAANTTLVAFQDGDGVWQAVAGQAGVYTFPVTGERYGLLAVCSRSGATPLSAVSLSYYAVSDGAVRTGFDQCMAVSSTTVTISGTVTGTQAGDQLTIDDGESSLGGVPVSSWTLPAVAGLGTLIAERRNSNQRPVAMLFEHVTFAAGASFALDFASSFLPAEAGLTLDPTGGNADMNTGYIASDGTSFGIDQASTSQGAVTTYFVAPDDHLGTGLSTLSEFSIGSNATRSVLRVFKTPVAQTLTLPPAFVPSSAPQVVGTMPYPILAANLPRRGDALYYGLSYTSTAPFRFWDLTYSAGWLAGAQGDVTSQLPDLSAITGWNSSYALSASGVQWSARVGTGTARSLPGTSPFGDHGAAKIPYQDGDEASTSSSSGTLP